MPIQKSASAEPITSAQFEGPMETNYTRFGMKGLNINDAIDAVEPNELTRMLNVFHRDDAALTSRRGQTSFTDTIGTYQNAVRRLNEIVFRWYTEIA